MEFPDPRLLCLFADRLLPVRKPVLGTGETRLPCCLFPSLRQSLPQQNSPTALMVLPSPPRLPGSSPQKQLDGSIDHRNRQSVVNAPATSQPNSAIPSNAQTHDELSRTPRPTTIRRHRAYTLRGTLHRKTHTNALPNAPLTGAKGGGGTKGTQSGGEAMITDDDKLSTKCSSWQGLQAVA